MAFFRTSQMVLALVICLKVASVDSTKEFWPMCTKDTDLDEESIKDNQAECSLSMWNLFNDQFPLFLKNSNMKKITISNPEPCQTCTLRGIEDVKLFENTTSKLVICNGKKCVDHVFSFGMNWINSTCSCAMDPNPLVCVKQMQNLLGKPNLGMECKAPPAVVSQISPPDIKSVCGDPTKFATMVECMPGAGGALGKVTGAFGKKKRSSTLQKGDVECDWKDVKLKVHLRACQGLSYNVFFKAELYESKPDAMKCKCIGPEGFMVPCNCMLAANFLKAILLQGIQLIFPCYCDVATKGYEKEWNGVHCKDYWC